MAQFAVFIVLLGTVMCIEHGSHRDVAAAEQASESARQPSSHRAARVAGQAVAYVDASASTSAVIEAAATAFDVPAGLLYGICQKESGCLAGGWGHDWMLATTARDGGCTAAGKSAAWCAEQWQALKSVCSRQRKDGSQTCDPETVRTSWAFAMGPFQLLPTTVLNVSNADGSVDFDGDGVVDPHAFADGAALAARFLANEYARRNRSQDWATAWIASANAYYGSQSSGYYSGKVVQKRGRQVRVSGVADHWRDWCASHECRLASQ